ncbi:MAG TPA: GH32 C-terminal domain-containing protein, partial [Chitinophagaceae bacterium]|nr:GH32 C-terminal domain-containing protein [Chitinophagaceae bacterium]
RELLLVDAGGRYALVSKPVSEFDALTVNTASLENITFKGDYDLSSKIKTSSSVARLDLKIDDLNDFSIKLSNAKGDQVELGYEKAANRYYIDRHKSGDTGFEKGFASRHFAPRLYPSKTANLTLVCDHSSIEMFADNGLTVMTSIFFPSTPMTNYSISSVNGIRIRELVYSELKPAVIR